MDSFLLLSSYIQWVTKSYPLFLKLATSPLPPPTFLLLTATILVKNSSLVSKKIEITSFSASDLVPSSSFYTDTLETDDRSVTYANDKICLWIAVIWKFPICFTLEGFCISFCVNKVAEIKTLHNPRLLGQQTKRCSGPSLQSLSWPDEPPGHSRLSFYTQSPRQAVCSFSFSLPARPLPLSFVFNLSFLPFITQVRYNVFPKASAVYHSQNARPGPGEVRPCTSHHKDACHWLHLPHRIEGIWSYICLYH